MAIKRAEIKLQEKCDEKILEDEFLLKGGEENSKIQEFVEEGKKQVKEYLEAVAKSNRRKSGYGC